VLGLVVVGDGLSPVEREAAREHRQPIEDCPGGFVEEFVAPVIGRPQGLMALLTGASPAREESEPLVETVGDLVGRQRRDASTRWNAIRLTRLDDFESYRQPLIDLATKVAAAG
jgi:hypothetical protein